MSDLSGVGLDGAGYVHNPQETLRRDVPLMQALERGPQDDPLVRREERTVGHEMAQALHQLREQNGDPDVSHDQMIQQLANQMIHNDGYGGSVGGGVGSGLGNAGGFGDSGMFGGGGDPIQQLALKMQSTAGLLGNGSGTGNDPGSAAGYGGVGSNLGGSSGGGYGHGYGGGYGADLNENPPFDQPFRHLYDGGRGDDQRFSAYSNRNTAGLQSGSAFTYNSDGTVTSPDQSNVYSGTKNDRSHGDFLHLSDKDYPGGFALNSESKNGDTRSINGEVDGHKVEVWTDNDGKVKAQVDGKVVDAAHPDRLGILKAQSDGSFTIRGRNSDTGASIDVNVAPNDPNGKHHGLTTTVSNINGPNNGSLHLGGFIGDTFRNNAGS